MDKWGVCVADNANNNDTYVAALVRSLRPDEESTARRSRCFAHMVNLAAKAFIYGKCHECQDAQPRSFPYNIATPTRIREASFSHASSSISTDGQEYL